MKKLLFMVAFMLVATFQTMAQEAAKKPQFQWNKKIMTTLGIADDVQAKIEDIKTASNAELKKVREDAALAEDAKKKTLKDLNAKRHKDIEALLTPEQKAKADALRKEMNSKE
jgi:Spy/CpxP family protein refolding chaperone